MLTVETCKIASMYMKENRLGPYRPKHTQPVLIPRSDFINKDNKSTHDKEDESGNMINANHRLLTFNYKQFKFPIGNVQEPYIIGNATNHELVNTMPLNVFLPILSFPMKVPAIVPYLCATPTPIVESSIKLIAFYSAVEQIFFHSSYFRSRRSLVLQKLKVNIAANTLTRKMIKHVFRNVTSTRSNIKNVRRVLKAYETKTLTEEMLSAIWATVIDVPPKVALMFYHETEEITFIEDVKAKYDELRSKWELAIIDSIRFINNNIVDYQEKKDVLITYIHSSVYTYLRLKEEMLLDMMHYCNIVPSKIYPTNGEMSKEEFVNAMCSEYCMIQEDETKDSILRDIKRQRAVYHKIRRECVLGKESQPIDENIEIYDLTSEELEVFIQAITKDYSGDAIDIDDLMLNVKRDCNVYKDDIDITMHPFIPERIFSKTPLNEDKMLE